MPLTLLQRARVLNGETVRLRVQEALRIVATEVTNESLPAGATAKEIRTHAKRQRLASHYKARPDHWAEVVIDGTFKGSAALASVVQDLDSDGLSAAQEAAVDAAILDTVRGSVNDYIDMVGVE